MRKSMQIITFLVVVCIVSLLFAAGGDRRSSGMRGMMAQDFNQWFVELDRAYAEGDPVRMGQLIEQMKGRQEAYRPGEGPGIGGPRNFEEQVSGPGPGGMGMGEPGMGGPGRRGTPFGSQTAAGSGFFKNPVLARDESEKKILEVIRTAAGGRMMNVPEEDGRLLRLLTEAIEAKKVVEIGTSNGVSGLWFSLALRKTGGKLITHEIDAERAMLARENFRKAGAEELITLVMGDAHETVKNLEGPIDLLFLDADKEGYLDYLEKLLPKVRPGGLIVAHNISPRQADPNYIQAITTNPQLESLLLNEQVSVTLKKR